MDKTIIAISQAKFKEHYSICERSFQILEQLFEQALMTAEDLLKRQLETASLFEQKLLRVQATSRFNLLYQGKHLIASSAQDLSLLKVWVPDPKILRHYLGIIEATLNPNIASLRGNFPSYILIFNRLHASLLQLSTACANALRQVS